MKRVFLGIFLLSTFACLACGQTDWAAQYKALQKLESKEDPKRFEQYLAFLEKCPDEWADRAFDLIDAGYDRIWKAATALYHQSTRETDPEKKEAFLKESSALYEPTKALGMLHYVERKEAFPFVRELAQATPQRRVALLKWYAELAGKDEPIKDDMVWFGPWCGTYDHTNEYKIEWAVQRYRKEAIETLRENNWSGRRFVMSSLGDCKDPGLKPLLLQIANEPNTLARGQALLSLSSFPGADVELVLMNALQSKSADTRAKAVRSMGKLKLERAVRDVFALCSDAVKEVAFEAVGSLGKIGTPAAGDCLTQLMQGKDPLIRAIAVGEIYEGKHRAAVPILREMFADKYASGRASLLGILAHIDPTGSEEIVLAALSETDGDVLQSAIDACKENKYRSAIPALQRFFSYHDLTVRKKATEAYEALVKPPLLRLGKLLRFFRE